jgi:hypothetical protein
MCGANFEVGSGSAERVRVARQELVGDHDKAQKGGRREANPFFWPAAVMLGFLLVLVCGCLIAIAPGFGIVLVLVLVPAAIQTAKKVRQKRELGAAVTMQQRAAVMTGSIFAVGASLTVVGLAAFGTFFCVCTGLALVTTPGLGGGLGAIMMVAGAAALAAVV